MMAILLACLPAAWLVPVPQANSRIALVDVRGSIWRGSAVLAGHGDAERPDMFAALLPDRLSWKISPLALVGMIDITLTNPALPSSLRVHGNWRRWQLERAALILPARHLAGLGAPLNTLQPDGQLVLQWEDLTLALANGILEIRGQAALELHAISSRLSALKPLGSYRIKLAWQGQEAVVLLDTLNGPLMLSGKGRLDGERLRFSGTAHAADGKEDALQTLLSLLGQREQTNGKTIIRLGAT